jgi:hypothetical protein
MRIKLGNGSTFAPHKGQALAHSCSIGSRLTVDINATLNVSAFGGALFDALHYFVHIVDLAVCTTTQR